MEIDNASTRQSEGNNAGEAARNVQQRSEGWENKLVRVRAIELSEM